MLFFLNSLLHVEGAAWNIEYRHPTKEVTEQGRVQGGRGHDELQVAAPGNHFPQNPEEHVGVQRPLVGFVHDDGAVRVQVLMWSGLKKKKIYIRWQTSGGQTRESIVTCCISRLLEQASSAPFIHSQARTFSLNDSRRSTPSVMNLITVLWEVTSSNRIA